MENGPEGVVEGALPGLEREVVAAADEQAHGVGEFDPVSMREWCGAVKAVHVFCRAYGFSGITNGSVSTVDVGMRMQIGGEVEQPEAGKPAALCEVDVVMGLFRRKWGGCAL